MSRRSPRDERGAVTAETVMAMPLLAAVTLGMVWLITLGVAQMQVTDAAREAARAVARGESSGAAAGLADQAAPGVVVSISREGDRVVVQARRRVEGPGGIFGSIPGAMVQAESVALDEESGSESVP